MVLGKLPVLGCPTIWMIVGQGPVALAVGTSGGCLDIFTLLYSFSPLSPSIWETARYRLKYCLKGPLNQKQTHKQTNTSATFYFVLFGFYMRFRLPGFSAETFKPRPRLRMRYRRKLVRCKIRIHSPTHILHAFRQHTII